MVRDDIERRPVLHEIPAVMLRWHQPWRLGLVVGAFVVAAGCGTASRAVVDDDGGNGTPSGTPDGPEAGAFETRDAHVEAGQLAAVAHLQGKVVAPNGTLPIGGALVYVTDREPAPIPDKAYCDTCITLSPFDGYGYSKPDGTFDIPAYRTGSQYLVVQKGQFRRVRRVEVVSGDQRVDPSASRLPSKNAPVSGDTIPKIAIANGGFDKVDSTLSNLGLEEFYVYGYDFIARPPGIDVKKGADALFGSAEEMGKYHIVLLPCATFSFSDDNGATTCGSPSARTQAALRTYVDGGGKLYVTDYSYEAVRQTWPGMITWYDRNMRALPNDASGLGTACRSGDEDTPGIVDDPALKTWLSALGDSAITLQASFTRMQKVSPRPGVDPKGNPVTITPKVWMSSQIAGQTIPATVSFEQRCGRVLMSSYHCEGGSGATLLPQEKALFYTLLEVGVCVGDLPPPPPPR